MTRVAYLGGAWATNTGNSFYNLGLLCLLRQVFGDRNVYHVPNLAGWYWHSTNIYDVVGDVEADLFVLSGPCFSRELEMYQEAFRRLRKAGSRLAFISVGAGKYSKDEQAFVSGFLDEFSDCLAFVTTRDRTTYELYQHLPCPVFDGVCGSMFLDEAVNVPVLRRPPYVVLNMDLRFEPRLRWDGAALVVDAVSPPMPVRTFPERVLRRFRPPVSASGPGPQRSDLSKLCEHKAVPFPAMRAHCSIGQGCTTQ